jgi:hypothetical protein
LFYGWIKKSQWLFRRISGILPLITQHVRDERLMNSLIEYLGCVIIYRKIEVFEYRVTKLSDLTEKYYRFFITIQAPPPALQGEGPGEKSKDF